jgi:hypothetical protein
MRNLAGLERDNMKLTIVPKLQVLKRHLLKNYTLSHVVIRYFILSKSSDALLGYPKVSDTS